MMRRLFKITALVAALVAGVFTAAASPRKAPAEKVNSFKKADSSDAPSEEDRHAHSGRADTRLRLIKIAMLLAALAFGGFLVAASGVIPIKASSGHWAITRWFLSFSMHRSIATHSIGLEAPALDEPGLVLKGAGQYRIACAACHGSPELQAPRIAQEMLPRPPYLAPIISEWEPDELFYIVKHGIKFTGMPAWPSQQRDDEVWAMVAFLRRFPELDAEEYRRLVNGEVAASGEVALLPNLLGPERTPRPVIESCGRCHGVDGLGRGVGAFPRLAGQSPAYLAASLQAYASGERHSGIMEPVAAGLSPEEMSELARYYASLERPSRPLQEATSAVERGEAIARWGIPSQRVPSCAACHGPKELTFSKESTFSGALPRNPAYPALAGQYADYLALQLELFKKGRRGGTAYAHLMRQAAAGLTPEQMRDVALYYASIGLR